MKGDTFELDCSLTGIPFPEIAWIKVEFNYKLEFIFLKFIAAIYLN